MTSEELIKELGELSGPPLLRRVKLILEVKSLLNETRNKS